MADHSSSGLTHLEALLADPPFAALLKCWEVDRRCPICLADYLREQGFEDEAVAAEWAATEPEKQRVAEVGEARGPSPWVCDVGQETGKARWWSCWKVTDYDDLPTPAGYYNSNWDTFRPFPQVLLWMLDYGARNVELFRRPVATTVAGNAL